MPEEKQGSTHSGKTGSSVGKQGDSKAQFSSGPKQANMKRSIQTEVSDTDTPSRGNGTDAE